MCSASKLRPSKLPHQNPTTSSDTEDQNPNPNRVSNARNPNPNPNSSSMEPDSTPFTLNGAEEDSILLNSDHLSRKEVIKRRHRRLKQEIRVYEDYYWALMEEYRVKHREYYWNYGKGPFEEDGEAEKCGNEGGGNEEGGGGKLGSGFGGGKNKKCAYGGCKSKAMVLTDYCHPHILYDKKQKLYKGCRYIIKSPHTGPVHCGKPILKATVPSLCSAHFEKARTHVTRALKKAGLNISSTSKLAPKFHVIVAESVRHINTKRRERKNIVRNNMNKGEDTIARGDAVNEENASVGDDVVMEENTDVGNTVI